MKKLLDELSEILQIKHPFIESSLQAGIFKEDISFMLQNTAVQLPEEVYDLYSWHNGLKTDILENEPLGVLWVFWMGAFTPFEFALEDYREFVAAGYWNEHYFPLFCSGGGDYYLIDCNSLSSTYRRILLYSPSNVDLDGIITVYDSLPQLLQSVIECYKAGAYTVDEKNYLQMNYEIEQKIAKANNPNSEYWRI